MPFPKTLISKIPVGEFCKKWKVSEFSLFGSAIRKDFNPNSDVDVLISFQPDAKWSLFDIVEMKQELEERLGRPVDVVEKEAIRNPFRRKEVLGHREVLFAA